MTSVINNLYFAYLKLYGSGKSGDILQILKQAEAVSAQTGDDLICIANEMLNDAF